MRSLILAFDTSTDVCTVSLLALGGDVPVLASSERGGGSRSHTSVAWLLRRGTSRSGAPSQEIWRAILVGTGPGTFTGVRIGIATARAMSLSVGCPVIGVPTLAALAAAVADTTAGDTSASVIVPVVDARRGQLFAGVYQRVPVHGEAAGGCWARTGDYFSVEPFELAAKCGRAPRRQHWSWVTHV